MPCPFEKLEAHGGCMRFGVVLFLLPALLNAAVVVDTQGANSEDVRGAIESGSWDNYHLQAPIEKNGIISQIEISKQKFSELPLADQNSLVKGLSIYYNGETNSSYSVWVGTKLNDLKIEPAMVRLAIPFETLPVSVWAEQLLSAYALKWAKKWSQFDGPNCYHTSMASIFSDFTDARYMGPQELLCHQRTYFDSIEKLELWGDMVSFDDYYGVPIHAFTYLGADRKDPSKKLVFTKNGYRVSPYLYMSYDEVYRIYESYGIAKVRYYRPKAEANALDPKKHTDSPCYSFFSGGSWAQDPKIGDALLEYRMRTAKIAPIRLN